MTTSQAFADPRSSAAVADGQEALKGQELRLTGQEMLLKELLLHAENLFYRRLHCLTLFQGVLLIAITQAWLGHAPFLRTFLCVVGAAATVLLAMPNMLLSLRLKRFILMERRLHLEAAGELGAEEEAHPLAGPLMSRAICGWVVPVAAFLMWIALLTASIWAGPSAA